jgi:hypothetical protein
MSSQLAPMSVPKATPDLDGEFAIFKNDVGAPRKLSVMYAVPVSSRENIFSHEQFGLGILASDL